MILRTGLSLLQKTSFVPRLCVKSGLHCGSISSAKLYSKKHEWVEVQGDTDNVRVGITGYAAEALGDVVFAQLPAVGEEVRQGQECGALESVKAASDIFSPVTGTVIQSNTRLEEKPALINTSPEEEAWMFELTLANRIELTSLMDKEGYDKFLKSVTDDLE